MGNVPHLFARSGVSASSVFCSHDSNKKIRLIPCLKVYFGLLLAIHLSLRVIPLWHLQVPNRKHERRLDPKLLQRIQSDILDHSGDVAGLMGCQPNYARAFGYCDTLSSKEAGLV